MLNYIDDRRVIARLQWCDGFFEGWTVRPDSDLFAKCIRNSAYVAVAVDGRFGAVVGFVTALSDNALSCYVPLIEVLPPYQGRGVGTELMKMVLARFANLYMLDVVCDEEIMPFYEQLGLSPMQSMGIRIPHALSQHSSPSTQGKPAA